MKKGKRQNCLFPNINNINISFMSFFKKPNLYSKWQITNFNGIFFQYHKDTKGLHAVMKKRTKQQDN